MKKHFSLYYTGWLIVMFETVMCAVCTLSVLMVNGADAIGADHISLFLLVAITIASLILMKARKAVLHKAVLWMAVLPLLFVGYEVMATFLMPYGAQSLSATAGQGITHMPSGPPTLAYWLIY